MECGVIYIKVCPTGSGAWIKHCHILSATPMSFQKNVVDIMNNINSKYPDDIVVKMDLSIHPGCTTTPEKVEEIATDMYNQFCELAERQRIPDSIRCVYTIGELSNVDVKSTHQLGNDETMVKLGHFLDESDEPGIYRI
jgi:hypothetical protein